MHSTLQPGAIYREGTDGPATQPSLSNDIERIANRLSDMLQRIEKIGDVLFGSSKLESVGVGGPSIPERPPSSVQEQVNRAHNLANIMDGAINRIEQRL